MPGERAHLAGERGASGLRGGLAAQPLQQPEHPCGCRHSQAQVLQHGARANARTNEAATEHSKLEFIRQEASLRCQASWSKGSTPTAVLE